MKLFLFILLLTLSFFQFLFISPAIAAELSNGAKVFSANCASCHIGGGNILIAEKTLRKEALSAYLENYAADSIQALINNIENGKNAMPAYKGKLSQQEILDVAAYIFQKAEQGW